MSAVWPALIWLAVKVGALSYGGGYVIIPLMHDDALAWMSEQAFANAVAYGQITPGPVTHTIAFVGYAAAGLPGALVATAVAFAPSFAFVMLGARHFERLRDSPNARAFLDGAGPAARGRDPRRRRPAAATAIDDTWQWVVLAAAAIALLLRVAADRGAGRRARSSGVATTLLRWASPRSCRTRPPRSCPR